MRKSLLVALLAAGLTFGSFTAFSQEGSSKDYPDQQNAQPADQQDPNAQAENQGTEQEPATQAENEGSQQQGGDQYTVKKGDNLSVISEQFYGTQAGWPELAKVNNIENPDLIFPDQNLTIPPKSEIAALNRGGSDMEQASATDESQPTQDQQAANEQQPSEEGQQTANEQQPAEEGQQAKEDMGSEQASNQSEIKGEVTAVAAPDLKLKDEQGTTHSLKINDQNMLKGIKVGDDVKVTLVKGKPTSIEKLAS